MKKSKIFTLAYILYLTLMMGGIYFLDLGVQNTTHVTFAWVVCSISLGLAYGYYAAYRDLKLFGPKWIWRTFKQLIKRK